MTHLTHSGTNETTEEGNTKTSSGKGRRWCITLNNYTKEEEEKLIDTLDTGLFNYVIGHEIGEQGTPHLQGYFERKNPVRFSTIKKWNNRLHIEKAKGNKKQNIIYCIKEGEFIIKGFKEREYMERESMILEAEYKDVKWRPFQEEILKIIDGEIDRRKIYWFHEETGNVGKSYVLKYIALKYSKDVIIGNGKRNDVFNQIIKHIEEGNEPKIVIIDIPRDGMDYFNYGCIEAVKGGCFYSGKYEGGKCYYKIPHVIIVSNDEPNMEKLSKDRYEVKYIE